MYIVIKKISQLKLMNIQNKIENFLLLVLKYQTTGKFNIYIRMLIINFLGFKIFMVIEKVVKSLRNFTNLL